MSFWTGGQIEMRLCAFLAALSCLFLSEAAALAAPGDLDETFSSDGIARTPSTFGNLADLQVAADGSVIIVGASGPNETSNLVVARYRPDGELDSSFSDDGVAMFDLGGAETGASLLLELGGSILVGGSADGRFLLLRLTPDGRLDPSFDGDGVIVRPDLVPAASIASASGDRVVVASGVLADDGIAPAAIRLLADGSPDPSFGADGISPVESEFPEAAHLVAVQSDDSVLLAEGSFLIKLDPRGEPVASFGQSGRVDLDFPSEARSIALSPTGDLILGVAGGTRLGPASSDNWILRVAADGHPSTVVARDSGAELAMASDGGAFIAGDRPGGDLPWTLTIRRLSSALELDTSFGRRGRAPAYNGIIPTLYTVGVGVGPDGDVVALAGLGDSRFMLARFETTFGKADGDADAVPDGIDRCPLGAARTRNGCREVRRELAFVRRAGRGVVRLDARTEMCVRAGTKIELFLRRPGPDRRLATTRIRYIANIPSYGALAGPGRYYVRARSSYNELAHCRGARSRSVFLN